MARVNDLDGYIKELQEYVKKLEEQRDGLLAASKKMRDILSTLYNSRALTVEEAEKFVEAEKVITEIKGDE